MFDGTIQNPPVPNAEWMVESRIQICADVISLRDPEAFPHPPVMTRTLVCLPAPLQVSFLHCLSFGYFLYTHTHAHTARLHSSQSNWWENLGSVDCLSFTAADGVHPSSPLHGGCLLKRKSMEIICCSWGFLRWTPESCTHRYVDHLLFAPRDTNGTTPCITPWLMHISKRTHTGPVQGGWFGLWLVGCLSMLPENCAHAKIRRRTPHTHTHKYIHKRIHTYTHIHWCTNTHT